MPTTTANTLKEITGQIQNTTAILWGTFGQTLDGVCSVICQACRKERTAKARAAIRKKQLIENTNISFSWMQKFWHLLMHKPLSNDFDIISSIFSSTWVFEWETVCTPIINGIPCVQTLIRKSPFPLRFQQFSPRRFKIPLCLRLDFFACLGDVWYAMENSTPCTNSKFFNFLHLFVSCQVREVRC